MTPSWIATRTLSDGSNQLDVMIAAPQQVTANEWKCAVGLKPSNGTETIEHALGEDAFQALILSIELLRLRVRDKYSSLKWIGGEPGDAGFPKTVPAFFGLAFAKRLEQLLDDEIERFAKNATIKP
jgi:hypothetical protein